jgi:hypothetical protein
MTYLCNLCGEKTDDPHGCPCGGEVFPSEPLDLAVGIEFGLFGPEDTGNDQVDPRHVNEGWSYD